MRAIAASTSTAAPDGVFKKAIPPAQDSYKFGINLGQRSTLGLA
jgi:hypothetical protein